MRDLTERHTAVRTLLRALFKARLFGVMLGDERRHAGRLLRGCLRQDLTAFP